MGKKLLTDDYNEIVKGAFKIDESDFHNYYLNIVNEHYESNNDIVTGLIEAVNRWIDWYRGQRGNHIMWEVNDDGTKHLYDQDRTGIPLLPLFGIYRHVDKSFFDGQIEQIERIKTLIELRELQKKLESLAPKIVVDATNQIYPYNDELDIEKLKERKRVFDVVYEKHEETQNETDGEIVGFHKFLDDFNDEVISREDEIVKRKPDIFNKITEQRNKFERADFDEERKEVEEWAKKEMIRFKGSLSRWYTKYGYRELSTDRGRKAVIEQGIQPVEVLAYFRCKELYQTATNSKHVNNVNNAPPRKRKFTANEDALAYIFDLYACGKSVPKNPVEGGFAANEIKEIGGQILLDGHKRGWDTQGAFYKAVKHVLRYDLNSISDLKNISADWLNAVKTLSRDWPKTRQYLTEKNLIDTSINDSGE